MLRQLRERLFGLVGGPLQAEHSAETRHREPLVHVIILDGTMSTLERGFETHAGVTYRLCREMGVPVSVYYEAGVQWRSWRRTLDVMVGRGINRQIRRAYGYLASRYRPGDRIFLFGYSRGAYAVRSLAGVIDMVGLVRAEHATVRDIRTAYRHYRSHPAGPHARRFRELFCHDSVSIEMIGVWDTVKALGLQVPLLASLAQAQHGFHNHQIGRSVRHGFHALALDETRKAFCPVMWSCGPDCPAHVEQVWFRGAHGDVGGQLGGFEPARPLANVPLVWMLDKAQACGLPLPADWRARFPCDPDAPSVGTWRGWGKLFWNRRSRRIGGDLSERIHDTVRPGHSGGVAANATIAPLRSTRAR